MFPSPLPDPFPLYSFPILPSNQTSKFFASSGKNEDGSNDEGDVNHNGHHRNCYCLLTWGRLHQKSALRGERLPSIDNMQVIYKKSLPTTAQELDFLIVGPPNREGN